MQLPWSWSLKPILNLMINSFSVAQAESWGMPPTLISVLSSHWEGCNSGEWWGPFLFSARVHSNFFAHKSILWPAPFPLIPGKGWNLQPLMYPRGHLSIRDRLGLSAPSPAALAEHKFRQVGQWVLCHRVLGKPRSAPCRPRAAQPPPGTQHSLIFALSSGDIIFTGLYNVGLLKLHLCWDGVILVILPLPICIRPLTFWSLGGGYRQENLVWHYRDSYHFMWQEAYIAFFVHLLISPDYFVTVLKGRRKEDLEKKHVNRS